MKRMIVQFDETDVRFLTLMTREGYSVAGYLRGLVRGSREAYLSQYGVLVKAASLADARRLCQKSAKVVAIEEGRLYRGFLDSAQYARWASKPASLSWIDGPELAEA